MWFFTGLLRIMVKGDFLFAACVCVVFQAMKACPHYEPVKSSVNMHSDINSATSAVISILKEVASTDCPPCKKGSQTTKTPFAIGDKVFILNTVFHIPSNNQITIFDRGSTIQRFTKTRVYIRTLNGHDTCRAPKNLRLMTNKEIENITQLQQQQQQEI